MRTTYTPANLTSVFVGHDAVVSATGVKTFEAQLDWIQAAYDAKVPRFVLNDYGNSLVTQVGLPELEQFRDFKRQGLALAEDLAAKSSLAGNDSAIFTWSALATGNFIDYSLKKYPVFGFDIPARSAHLVDDGMERLSAVTLVDIGHAVRGILTHPEETRNRYLHIRSVETYQREILAALEAQTDGGKKWDVKYESSEIMLARGREAFARGERAGMLDILVTQLFQKGAKRSVVIGRDESDNELLGVEEKDISAVVADVLATFNVINVIW